MQYPDDYWEERIPPDTHPRVAAAIKRVWSAYPPECLPQGICDPLYMMNSIALELGIGDGRGNFNIPD